VRVITRLDETCREVRDAARVIGDAELFKKMEEAQNKIKRDSECKLMIKVWVDNGDRMLSQLYSRPVCISEGSRATFVRLEGTTHRLGCW
jgi:hypothetical protein